MNFNNKLEMDLKEKETEIIEPPKIPRIIYTFWTGDNPIPYNRQKALDCLKKISSIEVILITKKDIKNWILPDHPFHPGYEYLSEVHKADFLRTYFMNFYGGGYCDIKCISEDWSGYFDITEKDPEAWICGYKEIPYGVAYKPFNDKWNELIGNGAYICRKQTPLTIEWYAEMVSFLDGKLEDLIKYPAKHPYDSKDFGDGRYWGVKTGYPIEWNEMLGRIFHRISYKYKEHLLRILPGFPQIAYR